MSELKDLKSTRAPLAYENQKFLTGPDGRPLRILSEYAEPLARFRRQNIQDTVVFFGSARFHSRLQAEAGLSAVERTLDLLERPDRPVQRSQQQPSAESHDEPRRREPVRHGEGSRG